MQRDIVFRGKRTDNGQWVEGYPFCYPYDTEILNSIICKDWYENDMGMVCGHREVVDPATVGQYTGVDKGGKRAFVGMGVKYDASHGHIVYGIIRVGTIPTDFGNNGQHVGFYVEWQNDGANMWNDWWRHDIKYWLEQTESELIDDPVPFTNE